MSLPLPEVFKIVEGISNLTDGAARTSDYIKLRGCRKAWCIVSILGGDAVAMDLNLYEAKSEVGASEQAIATAQRYWSNAATATSDTLVKQTAATSVNTAATAANKLYVLEVDPALLSDGFDWVCLKTEGDSAANLITAIWFLETSYAQATPPTVIA